MKSIVCKTKIVLIILTMIVSLAFSQDVDRTQRPVAKATPTVKLPEIEKTTRREKINQRLGPYALNLAPYFVFTISGIIAHYRHFRHFSAL